MNSAAYVKATETVLGLYDGKAPFAGWLKEYFRKEKKFGSRDRRTVSQLCFGYFRLGNLYSDLPLESRIYKGMELRDGAAAVADPLQIFPLHKHLSSEIDAPIFALSHLKQPDLFLRLRPGKERLVKAKLQEAGIAFTECAPDCLALPNGSKADAVLAIDAETVIQDRNSQQVLSLLQAVRPADKGFSLWDCCAASGGKSILAADRFPKLNLTASDIRESILHNLRARFSRAGIIQYRAFVADLAGAWFSPPHRFDVVLCDAPCSGSGTWGRTPEQLSQFTADRISTYADLQLRIAGNAARALQPGGHLLYITCSVFSAENEDNVARIQKESGLTLVAARYFKGYEAGADTLYAALFQS